MKIACYLGCLALLFGKFVMADEPLRVLMDFTGPEAAKEWQAVNDGVMGGVSEGRFRIVDQKTLEFFGTLSLANNGGFASVRTRGRKAVFQTKKDEWIEGKLPLDKFYATSLQEASRFDESSLSAHYMSFTNRLNYDYSERRIHPI